MSEVEIPRSEIRLALPSKGRMEEEVIELLNSAGLHVYKPNPRQYRATIPRLPGLTVLYQRTGDIIAMLAATNLGLGSVWVGTFDEKVVRMIIGAPETQVPVIILAVGYPGEFPEQRPRRPLDQLVHWVK